MSAKIDSRQIISISADVKRAMLDACAKDIENAADILIDIVKNGGKILWCGNGGSSADTQRIQEGYLLAEHIMCEVVENAILN